MKGPGSRARLSLKTAARADNAALFLCFGSQTPAVKGGALSTTHARIKGLQTKRAAANKRRTRPLSRLFFAASLGRIHARRHLFLVWMQVLLITYCNPHSWKRSRRRYRQSRASRRVPHKRLLSTHTISPAQWHRAERGGSRRSPISEIFGLCDQYLITRPCYRILSEKRREKMDTIVEARLLLSAPLGEKSSQRWCSIESEGSAGEGVPGLAQTASLACSSASCGCTTGNACVRSCMLQV